MLCERCGKREATIRLIKAAHNEEAEQEAGLPKETNLCAICAEELLGGEGGLYVDGLICLSDAYRSELYDRLEAAHPEAFYRGEDHKLLRQAAAIMETFLRDRLREDNVDVGERAFRMLKKDFTFSAHYYSRRKSRKQAPPEGPHGGKGSP